MSEKNEGKINVPIFELEQVIPEGDKNVFGANKKEVPLDNSAEKLETSIDKKNELEIPDNPEQEQVTLGNVNEKK